MKIISHSMLKAALIAASIIVLSLGSSSADESEKVREYRKRVLEFRTEQLKASWPKILAQWTPVAVSALHRERFNLPPRMVEPVKLNMTAQVALRQLLERTAIPADGFHPGCFYPTHAIVFRKDDAEFQLWIDFKCKEIGTPGAMPPGEWRGALKTFSIELKGYLNGLLDSTAAKRKVSAPDTPEPE